MIRRNPLVESFAPRPKDLWNQKCHTQKLIFLLFGYRVPKGCIKRYPLEPSLVGTTTLRCPNSRNHSWGDRRRPMEYIDPTDCWLHFTIYVIHDVYILHYVSKCIMCIYIYIHYLCCIHTSAHWLWWFSNGSVLYFHPVGSKSLDQRFINPPKNPMIFINDLHPISGYPLVNVYITMENHHF